MAEEALASSPGATGANGSFSPEEQAEMQALLDLNPGDLHDIKTNLQTLNKAIAFNRKSAKVTQQILRVPENHIILRTGRLHLFQMLSQKCNMTKDIETLHEAIELGWPVLLETPVRTPQLADVFYELGFLLTTLYEHAGWENDLDISITMHRFAVALTSKSSERYGHRLSQVGYGLSARVNLTNSLLDLDEAINISKRLLLVFPQGTFDWLMEGTNLGARYCVKYKLTAQHEFAEEAYTISQELISRATPGDQIYVRVLNNLVVGIGARFEKTGFQRDLEEAIRIGRLAAKYVPEADEQKASIVRTFCKWLFKKYKLVGDVSILREAIALSEQVVACTPPDGLESFRAHVQRSDLQAELFHKTNELGDLDKALDCTAQTANLVPWTEHKIWFRMHKQVASLAGRRFIINRHIRDWIMTLYMGIIILSKANVEELPDKLKDTDYRQRTLGKAVTQAQRFGTITEDDKHGIKAGDVVYEMYKRNIETMDFVDAFEAVFNEVAEIPMYFKVETVEEMQEFCKHLESFGLSNTFRLRIRFGLPLKASKSRKNDGDDKKFELPSNASIMELSSIVRERLNKVPGESGLSSLSRFAESTLALNTSQTPGYIDMLRVLVDILDEQYSRTGDIAYVMKAISNIDQILSMLDEADVNRAEYEGKIARLLQVRSRHTGSTVDINSASDHLQRALELTPDNAPGRSELQFDLAMILRTKHQHYGRLEDLKECIRNAKLAMSSMPKSAVRSNSINFALILRSSYMYFGSVSDLERAVKSLEDDLERALKEYEGCESTSHVELVIRSNLGLLLGDLYTAKHNVDDLTRAINLTRDLVERTKTMPNDQFVNLAINLATNLEKSYGLTGDPNELDEAISICKLIIKDTPLDHPRRSYLLVDAGSIVMRAIENDAQDLGTVDFAIGIFEEVERTTSPEHSVSGAAALQLGYALEHKNHLEPSKDNLSRCIQAFTRGWRCEGTFPTMRIQSAWRAARHLRAQEQVGEAAKLLRESIMLLITMAKQIAEREGQLNLLSLFPGLAGDAALLSLEDGQAPSQALQLLELGRNITNAKTMDYRSQLNEIDHGEYPDILRKFNHLRMEMDMATYNERIAGAADASVLTERQAKLQNEMNSLLEEVRCLPGYENTLGPQSPQDWINLADNGPIVVIAASGLAGRSDAIIIRKSGITSLPLRDLSYSEAHRRMQEVFQIARGPPSTFAIRNQTMQDHLSWIWTAAVQPILQELGFLAPRPAKKLPEICWIGVGILANMPFHAAGHHLEGSDANTLSKCISSYAPTLRSLLYTQLRRPKMYLNRKQDANILVVTMPTSPPGKGQALPSVLDESNAVLESAAAVPLTATALNLPSVSSVIQNMPINNLVHFACHGRPDPKNPLQSHLVLNDGDLSVADIARSLAAEADLAYLSACSTADCEDGKLVDEGIHVVSSFQLAGFRNVIGTLWETVDWACGEVAEEFYKSLFTKEPQEPVWDGKWGFSRALHSAVTKLRANDPDLPLLWAPFVHFGGE